MRKNVIQLANERDKINPDQLVSFAREYADEYGTSPESDLHQVTIDASQAERMVRKFRYDNRKGHDWRDKLVPESLDESVSFQRGKDPMTSMGVGKKNLVIDELKRRGMTGDEVDISPKFVITPNDKAAYHDRDRILEIGVKYMPEPYAEFAHFLLSQKKQGPQRYSVTMPMMKSLKQAIDDVYTAGASKEEIELILDHYGDSTERNEGKIYIAKLARTPEKEQEDEENNIYIFIGYTDKVPVTINGKQYYEDKFTVENMIKIDKYDPSQLSQVGAMKIRVRYQEHKYPDYGVYMLQVPKEVMDEENYYEIPEHLQDIVEKYKRKI